ncbi:hypothetical protein FG05_35261 [Fusarium graminearum]|nr:hypothetical protein FG05_35261 [Fusarium graminearum]
MLPSSGIEPPKGKGKLQKRDSQVQDLNLSLPAPKGQYPWPKMRGKKRKKHSDREKDARWKREMGGGEKMRGRGTKQGLGNN